MALLKARRAFFRRLASSEFHQILPFLRSDFRIGQAASYNLLLLNELSLPAHQCLRFKKVTSTGGKIRSFIFVRVRLHTVLVPARATNISKHFSRVLDSAFHLEPNIQVILTNIMI